MKTGADSEIDRPVLVVLDRQRKVVLDRAALQQFGGRALALIRKKVPRFEATRLARLAEVSVVLVSDRRMAALHLQYMNVAGPTDVLTFEHGEIFISTETARANARRFRSTTRQEIELYLVHGLLHLSGCDDTSAGPARRMGRLQESVARGARKSGRDTG